MFHAIRQNGSGSAFVLIRMLDVLTKVAEVERAPGRLGELGRHADLVLVAGETGLGDEAPLADLRKRLDVFRAVASACARSPTMSSPPTVGIHS